MIHSYARGNDMQANIHVFVYNHLHYIIYVWNILLNWLWSVSGIHSQVKKARKGIDRNECGKLWCKSFERIIRVERGVWLCVSLETVLLLFMTSMVMSMQCTNTSFMFTSVEPIKAPGLEQAVVKTTGFSLTLCSKVAAILIILMILKLIVKVGYWWSLCVRTVIFFPIAWILSASL